MTIPVIVWQRKRDHHLIQICEICFVIFGARHNRVSKSSILKHTEFDAKAKTNHYYFTYQPCLSSTKQCPSSTVTAQHSHDRRSHAILWNSWSNHLCNSVVRHGDDTWTVASEAEVVSRVPCCGSISTSEIWSRLLQGQHWFDNHVLSFVWWGETDPLARVAVDRTKYVWSSTNNGEWSIMTTHQMYLILLIWFDDSHPFDGLLI